MKNKLFIGLAFLCCIIAIRVETALSMTYDQQPIISYYNKGKNIDLKSLPYEQVETILNNAIFSLTESHGFLDSFFLEKQLESYKDSLDCLEISYKNIQEIKLPQIEEVIKFNKLLFVFKNKDRIKYIFWGRNKYFLDGFALGTRASARPITNILSTVENK